MSGILSRLLGSAAAAAITDAYFNLVTLLLNTTATNGAQNNTFLDSSTNNFSITRNGNTTQGTFTPFSQTGWSNYFNGTTDYLTIGTGVTFGAGAFTIECWFNANAFGTWYTIIGNGGGNSLVLSVDSATSVKIDQVNVGSDTYTVSSISLNAWHHLVVARDGSNNMTVFVDGVRATTGATTVTKNYSVSTKAVGFVSGGDYWHGYISNLRCVVGTAVYSPTSSTLTVPTTPLTAITNTALLTCQSNRFIDNSTNAYSLTPSGTPSVQAFSPFAPTAAYDAAVVGGSGYFDSNDDLQIGTASGLNFGTNNFTIECWYYLTSTAKVHATLISNGESAYSSSSVIVKAYYSSNGTWPSINLGLGQIIASANNSSPLLNQWNHVAVVRNGNTFTVYLNGVGGTPQTSTTTVNLNSNNITRIGYNGAYDGADSYFSGNIAGMRVLNGTALYTANFTPPTAPPTAITNTQLLVNYANAGIFDSAAKNDLETVGNAQVSTTQAKFGTTSIYFDGTGDDLTIGQTPLLNFGTGDFTIECWYYLTSTTNGDQTIMSNAETGYNATVKLFKLYYAGQSFPFFDFGSGNGSVAASNTSSLINQWNHVALVRSGNTFTMYLNGVGGSPATFTGSVNMNSNNKTYIGYFSFSDPNSRFTGYVDDLRVTRYARYVANFTPATAAFPIQ